MNDNQFEQGIKKNIQYEEKEGVRVNFTTLPNSIFHDSSLRPQDLGVICLLLSLPENWKPSAKGLACLLKCGEKAVNSSLGNLERLGYLERDRIINKGTKRWKYCYIISIPPNKPPKNKTLGDSPKGDIHIGSSLNRQIYEESKEYSTKELSNNHNSGLGIIDNHSYSKDNSSLDNSINYSKNDYKESNKSINEYSSDSRSRIGIEDARQFLENEWSKRNPSRKLKSPSIQASNILNGCRTFDRKKINAESWEVEEKIKDYVSRN